MIRKTTRIIIALGKELGVTTLLVDTGTLNDRNGRPTVKVIGGTDEIIHNVSNKQAKNTLPCAVPGLIETHLDPVMATGIAAETFTNFILDIGSKHYGRGTIAQVLALTAGQSMRLANKGIVSSDPRKRIPSADAAKYTMFGNGDDPTSGLILPLDSMMAADIVERILSGDDDIGHIGGADMVIYTKDPERMERVRTMTEQVLSHLGVMAPQSIRYTVYDENNGIKGLPELSRQIGEKIGISNYSQHDTELHV